MEELIQNLNEAYKRLLIPDRETKLSKQYRLREFMEYVFEAIMRSKGFIEYRANPTIIINKSDDKETVKLKEDMLFYQKERFEACKKNDFKLSRKYLELDRETYNKLTLHLSKMTDDYFTYNENTGKIYYYKNKITEDQYIKILTELDRWKITILKYFGEFYIAEV
jgi:hypothetical protein